MKYKYYGITKTRDDVEGIIEASDEVEARVRLRAMQVRPDTVEAMSEESWQFKLDSLRIRKVIDLKGLLVFTRQFSSLIDAGVPIVQCLNILQVQEKRRGFKRVLWQVKTDIEAGSGLAQAL